MANGCSSDSSMVDEYMDGPESLRRYSRVQIPLWSMNTLAITLSGDTHVCSDSSMVDEYKGVAVDSDALFGFRFLYGR